MSKTYPTQIEQVRTADLIPYAKNAKKHDDAQVAKIAGSIREFGFNNPVLVDKDNGIIAGHGRVLAAHKLRLKDVPCIRLPHLTDTQKRAYILADNRLAEIGGWDYEVLKLELADLHSDDIDIAGLGFDPAVYLAELFVNDNEATQEALESSAKEIDVDGMVLECRCPKCGFEFDPK